MRSKNIASINFLLTQQSFKEWLQTQGYSNSMVKGYPEHLGELFSYLEVKDITHVKQITTGHLKQFTEGIKQRENLKQNSGGLSAIYINNIIQGVNKFLEYLSRTKEINLSVELKRLEVKPAEIDILTVDEIKQLFQSLEFGNPIISSRNKAILACLYGAALRKTELVNLNVDDVSISNKTLHVRAGKGNKDRVIPIPQSMFNHIKEYIQSTREVLIDLAEDSNTKTEEALFVEPTGKRITGDRYYEILKQMIDNAAIESLQEKRIHPHLFRHSIATHLIQKGVDVEQVQRFLGHSSIDSTAKYLHFIKNNNDGSI